MISVMTGKICLEHGKPVNIMLMCLFQSLFSHCELLKCAQRKLDITGTAIEMYLLLFQSIKCPFQISVSHLDQNRTINYQFYHWF